VTTLTPAECSHSSTIISKFGKWEWLHSVVHHLCLTTWAFVEQCNSFVQISGTLKFPDCQSIQHGPQLAREARTWLLNNWIWHKCLVECGSWPLLMGVIYGTLLTTHEAAWYIILVTSVCLSVYQTITFESLDIGSSYLHIWYASRDYGSSSYMKAKVTGAKRSKIPIPAM